VGVCPLPSLGLIWILQDTNEKPFPCPYCQSSFQRSDVRALHVKKSHGIDLTSINVADLTTTGPKRKRVRVACDLCRRRKLRCDGENPCRQCRNGNTDCHYYSATHPTERVQRQARTRTEPVTRSSTNSQLQSADNIPIPIAMTGSPATFNDPSTQQDLVATSGLFDLEADADQETGEYAAIMPNSVSKIGVAFPLQNDVEHEMATDLWQMPLLVQRRLPLSLT
jgi:hypothetical protein